MVRRKVAQSQEAVEREKFRQRLKRLGIPTDFPKPSFVQAPPVKEPPSKPPPSWLQLKVAWERRRHRLAQQVVHQITRLPRSARIQAYFLAVLAIETYGRRWGYARQFDPNGLKVDRVAIELLSKRIKQLVSQWVEVQRVPYNFAKLYQYVYAVLLEFGIAGLEDRKVMGCLQTLDALAISRLNDIKKRDGARKALQSLAKLLVPSFRGQKNRPDNLSLRLAKQGIDMALSQLPRTKYRNSNLLSIHLQELFPTLSSSDASQIAETGGSLTEQILAKRYRRPVQTIRRWLWEAEKDSRIPPHPVTEIVRFLAASLSSATLNPSKPS